MSNHLPVEFEAYVRNASFDMDAQSTYEVQLFMNRYLVARWRVDDQDAWKFVNDQAHLNQFVAGKFFNLFKEES